MTHSKSVVPFPATVFAVLVLVAGCFGARSLGAQQQGNRPGDWSERIHDSIAALPVMHEGRIKPLLTVAGVAMMQMSNRRTLKVEGSNGPTTLDPVDWWLDVTLRPDLADHYLIFKVTDVAAVEQVGISTAGRKKRDSFSYAELEPGLDRLFAQAQEFGKLEEKQRTRIQKQTLVLSSRVMVYKSLRHMFEWARVDFELGDSEALRSRFDGASTVTFSEVLARVDTLWAWYRELDAEVQRNPQEPPADYDDLHRLLSEFSGIPQMPIPLKIIPKAEPRPLATAEPAMRLAWEEWRDPMTLAVAAMRGNPVADEEVAMVAALEAFVRAEAEDDALAALGELGRLSEGLREQRGIDEGAKVDLEVTYHSANLHWHSIWMFLLAMIGGLAATLVAMTRMQRVAAALRWGGFGVLGVGLGMLVTAIVIRCLILSRPPVTNLYETILFVGAVAVILAMVAELIYRRGFAVAVAGASGALAVIGAHRFETGDGRDQMSQLQAVLADNFWLATHVTTINIGYAAAMLAAVIGAVALIAYCGVRLVSPGREPARYKSFFKTAVAMVYGVTCFGVLLSAVGTILGGVWANDSWGRFWGWDPKENGALMIVLAQLFLLHGRMSGHLRPFGQCMVAAGTGAVVIFSWFHTNQLGVGLHAYGFSESLHIAIYRGYTAFGIAMGIGILGRLIEWFMHRTAPEVLPGGSGAGSSGPVVKPEV